MTARPMRPDDQLRFGIFQQGQRAFGNGQPCPYLPTHWKARTWRKGWEAAQQHHLAQLQTPAPTSGGEDDPMTTAPNTTAQSLVKHHAKHIAADIVRSGVYSKIDLIQGDTHAHVGIAFDCWLSESKVCRRDNPSDDALIAEVRRLIELAGFRW